MFRLILGVTFVTFASCGEIFRHNSFSSGSSMLSSFHPQNLWGTEAMDAVSNPDGSGHVLRVHYAQGSYSGTKDRDRGAGFYSAPTSHHDSMMLSYDVFFADNFDWVKGGKLPGLWGGSTTCTGGRHSDDCFTLRLMWRSGGQGEVYAYIPRDQDSSFCSRSDVHCNFDYGNSLGRGKWHFKKGEWQTVGQYVHLNRPGHHDGYIKVFIDGSEVYRIDNIAIRTKSSIHIDGFVFSTFFGGSDDSWASTRSTYTYFKNFVLSTSSTPIGK